MKTTSMADKGLRASGWGLLLRLRSLWLLLPLLMVGQAAQAQPSVDQLRVWRSPDNTRLVFDLSSQIDHSLFTLKDPHRIVLDLDDVQFQANPDTLDLEDTPIRQVRTGVRPDGGRRVVLDLKQSVKPRSFALPPNDEYSHRLVVDLFDKEKEKTVRGIDEFTQPNRDIIIAIDAGHGGEDPGALGPGNIQEKEVVLAIARKLQGRIDATPGYRAVMARTGDYYIPLGERPAKGRSQRADLFLSIHADAFRLPQASGASVYALSQRGATSETAAYLAQRENRADLIGGVGELSLKDKDDTLASVLLDLSMNAALDTSLRIGQEVVEELGRVTKLHKHQVEQAGFAVLKSPDMPSLLVEAGFISNPQEARQLRQSAFQSQLAAAVFRGVRDYFERHPPEGSLIANQGPQEERTYVIQSGDTLSEIAERFGVSMSVLRQQNNLSKTVIQAGQELQIPTS